MQGLERPPASRRKKSTAASAHRGEAQRDRATRGKELRARHDSIVTALTYQLAPMGFTDTW